jgi:hypothetical protein
MKKVHNVLYRNKTKPWLTWIRDGINSTNISMLQLREIDPIQKYMEEKFMGGFKFSYLN